MKLFIPAAVAASGLIVSGCATIIQGTTQSVSVATTPESGGIGVDAASGANYHYDSPITVPLGTPVISAPVSVAPAR
jgi:hypothetical protein